MSDCQHNAPGSEFETGDVQIKGHQLDADPGEDALYRLVDCLYSDGDADIEAIDRYLEELDQAEAEPEEFDIEMGLQQFHDQFDKFFEYRIEDDKPARKRRSLARVAIIAAAMCIFVATAQASGWDILGAIAQWTNEQFSYVAPGNQKDDVPGIREFASLQEALDACYITESLSPTLFPEGTEFLSISLKDEGKTVAVSASYNLDGEGFYISIRKIGSAPYSEVEINDPNVEVYLAGGIEHHLVNDVKQRKASWCNGNWECYIEGQLTRDDLLVMIDSIYK